MSIEASLYEQELLAETFQQARSPMARRQLLAEVLAATGFAAAVAALWMIRPPQGLEIEPALVCTLVLALATLVRFETPMGFTVPTQLAFVPLLFAVPVAFVPIATVASLAIARVPHVLSGRLWPTRLLHTVGNAWFAIGPAAVFAIAGVEPRTAGIALLLAALAAQFAVDFAASTLRVAVASGASLRTQLQDTWVYAIDAALAGVGLEVAKNIPAAPAAALTLVPLLGLLAVFARERHRRLEGLLELNGAYRGTALVLSDVIDAEDGYTGEHSKEVVRLALAVAARLKLGAEERRNLEFAAALHDIGKIAIPKEILNKPDKLGPAEWSLMKTHTIEGQKMLDRVGGFMHDVGLIVRSHHERWDGRGYPDGLAGEAIPLESRIIACCDTWHAMRSDRSYRKALSHEAALDELLASAGSQLDRTIVERLVEVVAAEAPPDPRTAPPSALLVDLDEHVLDDARSSDPVERLLEECWGSRFRRAGRREVVVEAVAAALFLAVAVPLALPPLLAGQLQPGLTALLVGLYALARTIKFPIGAGYVMPSYLVLVPMLLLLPPGTVPLLTAVGLVLGAGLRVATRRGTTQELLFSVPDAWHAVGPAVVLLLAGPVHGAERAVVFLAALFAGFLMDLVVSTLRESLAQGIAPPLQGRVIASVWLVDACIAPLGLLVAQVARTEPAALLLVVPLMGLFMVVDRDRSARIAEAQHRLGLVARERTRLQAAVQRLGDAFAAKLDLQALTDVLLRGTVDALDADAGRLILQPPAVPRVLESFGASELEPLLQAASDSARSNQHLCQLEAGGACALALPLAVGGDDTGAVAVARRGRPFGQDERALMLGLVERAERAAQEILAHEALREQAMTDPLTRLGNRRKLSDELGEQLNNATAEAPLLLMLFDLDGFKSYNDTFGHVAGDVLLARLGHKLAAAVASEGGAYRLGGDEFCVLLPARREALHDAITAAAGALEEHGETFAISASCGTVLLPHEARTVDYALQLADERMYAHKQGRPSGAREQAHDVLIHIMRAKQPSLPDHAHGVGRLAIAVGRRMGMSGEQLDELGRAATLHDVGKVGLPDAILSKPGPLDADEWSFVRQHTLLGERILSAAPALRPVATIVRHTHERWDGNGYPDGLTGEQIPLAARIVAVCDAYDAITSERCYRSSRSPEEARDELRREAGRQFDPTVVEVFLRELERPVARVPGSKSAAQHRELFAAAVVSHVDELLESPTAQDGCPQSLATP